MVIVVVFLLLLGVFGYIAFDNYYQNVQKTRNSCRSMVTELDSILGSQSESYDKIWKVMTEVESGRMSASSIANLAEQETPKMKELGVKYDSLMDTKHIDCFGFPAKAKK